MVVCSRRPALQNVWYDVLSHSLSLDSTDRLSDQQMDPGVSGPFLPSSLPVLPALKL